MKNSLLYRRIGLCVVLSAATVLAYGKTFPTGFVGLDVVTYLTQSPRLEWGVSLNAVEWAAMA